MESIFFLLLIVGSFYLLAIRPQKARLRALRETQEALQPGLAVMTTAGLYGTVTRVTDEDVHLEVAPGVEVRFARAAVARRVDEPTGGGSAATHDGAATDSTDPASIPPG
ncbi:MAG TPA: preprotein translocase subunit YajC [Mycobacteriales bacterium]|nr:preprotein translocase subunit YajC [Mycobacteriales bacterium]